MERPESFEGTYPTYHQLSMYSSSLRQHRYAAAFVKHHIFNLLLNLLPSAPS